MNDVVLQARQWLGVPFRHQGRGRNGCDCLGLLMGIAGELSLLARDGRLFAHWDETNYGHLPDAKKLYQSLAQALQETAKAKMSAGDVVLMDVEGRVQHLGVLSPYPYGGLALIHAYAPFRKVVEHRLTPEWQANIRHVFRLM